jgi:hypothetical protein
VQPAVEALVAYCRRDIVEAPVESLIEAGVLSGKQVHEVKSECVAVRAAKEERQRRDDWHQRETSAAEFLKGLELCS